MCLSAANALPPNVGQRYAVATPKPQPCARLTAHHLRRSGHRFQTCCLVNLFFGQQHLNNELIPQMLHVCSNVRNLLCIGSVRCSFFFVLLFFFRPVAVVGRVLLVILYYLCRLELARRSWLRLLHAAPTKCVGPLCTCALSACGMCAIQCARLQQ